MSKKIAFFDIDGTVFRSSLLIEIVEQFIKDGVFDAKACDVYSEAHVKWLNREGNYEAYIGAVVESFIENIKGVSHSGLTDVGRAVVAVQSKKVYQYTRDLIESLKQNDYYIVAISQSPKTVLDHFCASYGFDKVYGRIYEVDAAGNFTGVVTDEELIENKATIVHRVYEQQETSQEWSIGVGDTEGDIPLLESVARPICFNPNKVLYEYAKEKNWEVVVERKDVIYTMPCE